jgi:hypothetical protein
MALGNRLRATPEGCVPDSAASSTALCASSSACSAVVARFERSARRFPVAARERRSPVYSRVIGSRPLTPEARFDPAGGGEAGAAAARRPRRADRWFGAAGIAYPIFVILGDDVIASNGEPPGLNATRAEVARYLAEQPGEAEQWLGRLLAVVGLGFLAVFFGRLYAGLRASTSRWLPELALGAALVAIGIYVAVYAPLAAIGFADDPELDVETARLAYAVSNALFILPWAPLAVALFAAAAVVLGDNVLPRWFGWATLVQAIAFVVGLAASTATEAAFFAYVLFWLWLLVAAPALTRRPLGGRLQPS